MPELRQWAADVGIVEAFGQLEEELLYNLQGAATYVAGPTGMHLTSQLDGLQPGDHKREALGPRTSLGALSRAPAACCSGCAKGSQAHTRLSPIVTAGTLITHMGRRFYARRYGPPRPVGGVGLRGFVRQALHDYRRRGWGLAGSTASNVGASADG